MRHNEQDRRKDLTIGCSIYAICALWTALSIIFAVLKLCKVIGWAWIYVSLPLIIEIGFVVLVIAISISLETVKEKRYIEHLDRNKKEKSNHDIRD